MAADVVKEYLLPLFEADDLKYIRVKGKPGVTANNLGKVLSASPPKAPGVESPHKPNTVYEELKLSEQLSNELGISR